MFLRWKRWCVVLGLAQATLLACPVVAHPISHDAPALRADAGTAHGDLDDPSALTSPTRASALELMPASTNGRFTAPAETLPRSEGGSAVAWAGEPRLAINENPAHAGLEEADSLPGRSAVGPAHHERATATSSRATRPGEEANPGAEILQELQESVAEVIIEALDMRIGPDGRASFSLAGMEGFQVAREGGNLTLGHGDASLAIIRHDAGTAGQRPNLQPELAPRDVDPTHALIKLGQEVIQYPLTWVVLFFLVLGKISLLIATRKSRKRRHRGRSRSHPTRLKVKRSRPSHRPLHATGPVIPGLQEN